MKKDKRITKTEYNIKSALATLLEKKKIEDINVSELAKIAMISRKTFYIHYNSVEEVLDKIKKETHDRLKLYIIKYDVVFDKIEEFVENFYKIIVDDEILVAMLSKTYFTRELFMVINKSIIDGFLVKYEDKIKESIPFKLTLEYNIHGCSRLFYSYINKQEKSLDFQSFINIVSTIIKQSLTPYVR